MNKANARTRYAANEANIAAWHRRIRKAGSKVAALERDRERLKMVLETPDRPEVAAIPPAPVFTSEGIQLGVAQNLVDAGDFIGRGQNRAVATAIKEGSVPLTPPTPPTTLAPPPTVATQMTTLRKSGPVYVSGMPPGVVMRSGVVSNGPSPFGNLGRARTRSRMV